PGEILVEYLLVEKKESAKRLVLRGSRYLPLRRQVAQVPGYLLWAQRTRMAPVVEQDEAPYPLTIGFLRLVAVMMKAKRSHNFVHEPWWHAAYPADGLRNICAEQA